MSNEIKNPNELLSEIIKLKKGGEVRSQQDQAVAAIHEAITKDRNIVIEAPTGAGKALDLNTPIFTFDGWKTMGTITTDDFVFDEKGDLVKVLKVHEPFFSEKTYKITFDDGETIVADSDHLWYTVNNAYINHGATELNSYDLKQIHDNIAELRSVSENTDTTLEELQQAGVPKNIIQEVLASLIPVRNTNGQSTYNFNTILELIYQTSLNLLGTYDDLNMNMSVVSTQQIFDTQRFEGKPAHAIPRVLNPLRYISGIFSAEDVIGARQGGLDSIMENFGKRQGNSLTQIKLDSEKDILAAKNVLQSLGFIVPAPVKRTNKQGETMWSLNFNSTPENTPTRYDNLRAIVKVEKVESVNVRCITVDSDSHMFLAGKNLIPTFNTLSYLIPVIFNGTKAVISTATKQLSEQIMHIEIPFVRRSLEQVMPDKKFTAALLKGRDNYYCKAKGQENEKLTNEANSLFGTDEIETNSTNATASDAKKFGEEATLIVDWATTTKTGDRSDAPAVSDQTWRQYSSNTSECPGKTVCGFGEECFAEYARDNARKADIVVTNHAIVANDLLADESVMLGERDLIVFDEMHELDKYLSSAWGTRLTQKMLKDSHTVFKTLPDLKSKDVDQIESMGKKFNGVLGQLEEGMIKETPPLLGQMLQYIYAASGSIVQTASKLAKDDGERESTKKIASVVVKKATGLMEASVLLLDDSVDTVRWVTVNEKDDEKALNAAPLRIGPQLQTALESRDAKMVATSATIRVGGSFDIPVHNLALNATNVPYETVALSTPFHYAKQGMLYIPNEDTFPAPIGKDRFDHKERVKEEVGDLVKAMGGRALCLYTTREDARQNAEYLRKKFPKMNILFQDDAPVKQLIKEFQEDEKSVFVATMGMWHGLDIPGPSLSLVTIDKLPFKPMNDPLSTARQDYANDTGRNGFMDVYLADAIIMLAQGVGRLVRSSSDKGIVAILDTRIVTKRYGSAITRSLPDMKIFQNKEIVIGAAQRLATGLDTNAKK